MATITVRTASERLDGTPRTLRSRFATHAQSVVAFMRRAVGTVRRIDPGPQELGSGIDGVLGRDQFPRL